MTTERERLAGATELSSILARRGAPPADPGTAVAAVACESEADVREVLRAARSDGVQVVAAGARSRLGRMDLTAAAERRILLDMTACRGVLALDADALWLRVRAGTPLAEAARAAAERGLRLAGVGDADGGTAGGWLSMTARIPDPLLGTPSPPALGLAVVFPDGASWRSIDVPRSACGPELNALFYGTAGAFGVVTEATLRLVPPGAERQRAVWHLLRPASAAEMLRRMALGPLPPVEAQAILWVDGRGTRLQAVFEGAKGLVREALRDSQEQAHAAGARELRDAGDERIDPPAELPAAAVRWSQLDEVLSKLYLPAVDALVLDRPEIAGCRLRLIGGDPAELRMRLRRALDQDGERARRRLAQFERLRRLKREWDPGALLNPHALSWLEREATA